MKLASPQRRVLERAKTELRKQFKRAPAKENQQPVRKRHRWYGGSASTTNGDANKRPTGSVFRTQDLCRSPFLSLSPLTHAFDIAPQEFGDLFDGRAKRETIFELGKVFRWPGPFSSRIHGTTQQIVTTETTHVFNSQPHSPALRHFEAGLTGTRHSERTCTTGNLRHRQVDAGQRPQARTLRSTGSRPRECDSCWPF
jgi:hypothetical protein